MTLFCIRFLAACLVAGAAAHAGDEQRVTLMKSQIMKWLAQSDTVPEFRDKIAQLPADQKRDAAQAVNALFDNFLLERDSNPQVVAGLRIVFLFSAFATLENAAVIKAKIAQLTSKPDKQIAESIILGLISSESPDGLNVLKEHIGSLLESLPNELAPNPSPEQAAAYEESFRPIFLSLEQLSASKMPEARQLQDTLSKRLLSKYQGKPGGELITRAVKHTQEFEPTELQPKLPKQSSNTVAPMTPLTTSGKRDAGKVAIWWLAIALASVGVTVLIVCRKRLGVGKR